MSGMNWDSAVLVYVVISALAALAYVLLKRG